MPDLTIRGAKPPADVVDAVYEAASVLDIWECYQHEGRYHFVLGGGWSLAVSADSADRVRIETCRLTRPVDTMWATAQRRDRLAGLIRRMSRVPEAV